MSFVNVDFTYMPGGSFTILPDDTIYFREGKCTEEQKARMLREWPAYLERMKEKHQSGRWDSSDMASGEKAWQADTSGSHTGRRRTAAQYAKKISYFIRFVRNRGRAGRKRPESTEKSPADLRAVLNALLSGLYSDALFFHPFRHQHKSHIF